jgi:hypothetical protein
VTSPETRFSAFGADRDVAAAIAGELRRRGGLGAFSPALRALSEGARTAATDEVAAVATAASTVDLSAVLAEGWTRYAALRDAGRATVADPATSKVVELARHEITSAQRPYVDVLVNEVPVTRVNLELRLVLVIVGLAATVRAGRLVHLTGGDCEATATLAVEGATVLSRPWRLDLPLEVPLGAGIPLTRPTPAPAGNGLSQPAQRL